MDYRNIRIIAAALFIAGLLSACAEQPQQGNSTKPTSVAPAQTERKVFQPPTQQVWVADSKGCKARMTPNTKFTWDGRCVNGYADGEGVLRYESGVTSSGTYRNGLQTGRWIVEWHAQNGNISRKEISDCLNELVLKKTVTFYDSDNPNRENGTAFREHQYGVLTRTSYKSAQNPARQEISTLGTPAPHGRGDVTYSNGVSYSGGFFMGKRQGFGVLRIPLSSEDVASWRNDGKGYQEGNEWVVSGYFSQSKGTLIESCRKEADCKIPRLPRLHECAAELSAECVWYSVALGDDIDAPDAYGWTPIFYTIVQIYNKGETPEALETLRMLIELGANLDVRANPDKSLSDKAFTPEELLKTNLTRFDFQITKQAPVAPRARAMFADAQIRETARKNLEARRRAREIGLSVAEFDIRLLQAEQFRSRNTFEGFYQAFLATRNKDDFSAAQRLAKSAKEKKKLEYMAILATSDKTRIFDFNVTIGDRASKATKPRNTRC